MSAASVLLEGGLRWEGSYSEPLETNTRVRVASPSACADKSDGAAYIGLTKGGVCSFGSSIAGSKHDKVTNCWKYNPTGVGGDNDCTVVYRTSAEPPASVKISDDRVEGINMKAPSMTQEECASLAKREGKHVFYRGTKPNRRDSTRADCYLKATRKKNPGC